MFKEGQRVYSPIFGWGVVTKIHIGDLLEVKSTTNNSWYTFYLDGKYMQSGDQMLFHDKPTIIPPKQRVKKWIWAYKTTNGCGNTITHGFYSEKEIDHLFKGITTYTKLYWTETEVEEE